VILLSNLKTSI